jgi:hypothetical protein
LLLCGAGRYAQLLGGELRTLDRAE